jgi:light-independent protochlorophyllide reductase B subunit
LSVLEHSTDPYNRCALYGAALTVTGLQNTATVVHAPQGCAVSASSAYSYQNVDFTKKLIACSKLCETDIVTGGEIKLSYTLRQTARAYDADLIVVLAGCAPEIIGDDILSIAQEVEAEVGLPVVPLAVGGFRGSEITGIDIALQTLVEKLASPCEKKNGSSVNVIAPFASANPGWMADLAWVKSVLNELGVTVNAVLCSQTHVSDVERAGCADANILLSHNAGHPVCRYMETHLDIPHILRDMPLPIGLHCTRRWIETLGEYFGKEQKAEEIVERGEDFVVDTLRLRFLPIHWFHEHPTSIVGDFTLGIGLLDFITRELEMDPQLICMRKANNDAKSILESVVKELHISPKIVYDADVATVQAALEEVMPMSCFGSLVEKHLCREIGTHVVYRLFNPVDRVDYFDYPYMGYNGLLKVLEFTVSNWRNSATEGFR